MIPAGIRSNRGSPLPGFAGFGGAGFGGAGFGGAAGRVFIADASLVTTEATGAEAIININAEDIRDEANIMVMFQLSQAHVNALRGYDTDLSLRLRFGASGELRRFRALNEGANYDVRLTDIPPAPVRYLIVTAGNQVNAWILGIQEDIGLALTDEDVHQAIEDALADGVPAVQAAIRIFHERLSLGHEDESVHVPWEAAVNGRIRPTEAAGWHRGHPVNEIPGSNLDVYSSGSVRAEDGRLADAGGGSVVHVEGGPAAFRPLLFGFDLLRNPGLIRSEQILKVNTPGQDPPRLLQIDGDGLEVLVATGDPEGTHNETVTDRVLLVGGAQSAIFEGPANTHVWEINQTGNYQFHATLRHNSLPISVPWSFNINIPDLAVNVARRDYHLAFPGSPLVTVQIQYLAATNRIAVTNSGIPPSNTVSGGEVDDMEIWFTRDRQVMVRTHAYNPVNWASGDGVVDWNDPFHFLGLIYESGGSLRLRSVIRQRGTNYAAADINLNKAASDFDWSDLRINGPGTGIRDLDIGFYDSGAAALPSVADMRGYLDTKKAATPASARVYFTNARNSGIEIEIEDPEGALGNTWQMRGVVLAAGVGAPGVVANAADRSLEVTAQQGGAASTLRNLLNAIAEDSAREPFDVSAEYFGGATDATTFAADLTGENFGVLVPFAGGADPAESWMFGLIVAGTVRTTEHDFVEFRGDVRFSGDLQGVPAKVVLRQGTDGARGAEIGYKYANARWRLVGTDRTNRRPATTRLFADRAKTMGLEITLLNPTGAAANAWRFSAIVNNGQDRILTQGSSIFPVLNTASATKGTMGTIKALFDANAILAAEYFGGATAATQFEDDMTAQEITEGGGANPRFSGGGDLPLSIVVEEADRIVRLYHRAADTLAAIAALETPDGVSIDLIAQTDGAATPEAPGVDRPFVAGHPFGSLPALSQAEGTGIDTSGRVVTSTGSPIIGARLVALWAEYIPATNNADIISALDGVGYSYSGPTNVPDNFRLTPSGLTIHGLQNLVMVVFCVYPNTDRTFEVGPKSLYRWETSRMVFADDEDGARANTVWSNHGWVTVRANTSHPWSAWIPLLGTHHNWINLFDINHYLGSRPNPDQRVFYPPCEIPWAAISELSFQWETQAADGAAFSRVISGVIQPNFVKLAAEDAGTATDSDLSTIYRAGLGQWGNISSGMSQQATGSLTSTGDVNNVGFRARFRGSGGNLKSLIEWARVPLQQYGRTLIRAR